MILQAVPSGTIEVVLVDHQPHLQFNCACLDALPICHAACCRSRPRFNVRLTPDEAARLESVTADTTEGPAEVLNFHDGACGYLTPASRCQVHDQGKPMNCQTYHCSPGGPSPAPVRSRGFLLLPVVPG